MNLVICGPCGVGKSSIAIYFAHQSQMKYLDLDEIRAADMERRKGVPSPCSVSYLNLIECLSSKLDGVTKNFVLDIGGDTVFRPRANNIDRLNQIFWLKKTYAAKVALLMAKREILLQRFNSSKKRNESEFDQLWKDWYSVGLPFWQKCADKSFDTSTNTIDETSRQLQDMLNNCI